MEQQKVMSIYQHFRKEEQTFIDWVYEQADECIAQYRPVLTQFLNPRQRSIVQAVVGGNEDVKIAFYGGFAKSEWQRALFYPPYYEPTKQDFDLQLCTIHYPVKFAELSHSSILGSLLGTGIARDRIGDIIHSNHVWQFITTETMMHYIQRELKSIGKIKATIEPIDLAELVGFEVEWEVLQTTVSSLRVDTVIAQVCGFSRQRAKETIERERVKLNWAILDRPDIDVAVDDMLSIRGFGRIAIKAIGDRTKKNRIRLEIEQLKNKR